ncbi:tumor necrosis factor alpha-induced protein 2a isoform X2 [Dunckerocampus dactyliophorus]|uniref:tumor necrosis factor alpha-induced protein 2a isoform X2 n=1 Tax=Dunckerocampus dactyliophorus TaxID=161453 RepID=UPI002404AC0F|nr:tumor necrosis factor alpha-induced protein 2a isoform X2 [Dunckerocampus dactyliophorus]
MEEKPEGEGRRRLPRLKITRRFWKNSRQQDHPAEETESEETSRKFTVIEGDLEETSRKLTNMDAELDETSRKLVTREEELFSQDPPSEEDEDQLQRDLETLKLHILMVVNRTFNSSSSVEPNALKSAVAAMQLQEAQDRRWAGRPVGRVPMWRPQKCLSAHNMLLAKVVESRLAKAAEDELSGTDGLSSPLKRQVCRMGKRVKEDLLRVSQLVQDCYGTDVDVVNVYAGLCHGCFSARLTQMTSAGLEADDSAYLLFWANCYYPQEILEHEDLRRSIKTSCLGALLPKEVVQDLEEQYMKRKEMDMWLHNILHREEDNWSKDETPEIIDNYYFSPLAINVIQVIDGSLKECSSLINDDRTSQKVTAHLESFLGWYKKSVEKLVKRSDQSVSAMMKAHLACEEQLRDYVRGQTGSVTAEQRHRCEDILDALRDSGYSRFTRPIHQQLKVYYKQLWTSGWLDGSLPVVDSLLDSLYEHLADLADMKPSCRQRLLCVLHEDTVVQYLKRMMKSRMKSRRQQVDGAQRMTEDAQKMNDFFSAVGCSGLLRLGTMLCNVAEILRLHDPGSVRLEMVAFAMKFPDLSDILLSSLLTLKSDLSADDARSIRRSLEEVRPFRTSTSQSSVLFSKLKVQWVSDRQAHLDKNHSD